MRLLLHYYKGGYTFSSPALRVVGYLKPVILNLRPAGIFRDSTENSLAVLNHKILEANSQVQNVKLGGHQTCLSINRLWHELCDMLRRLVGTTALDIMIVQFRNEKVSNHASIPITIDCNVVAFIVFEEVGFRQPIKRTKQSVLSGCNGVSIYTCGLASLQMRQFFC
ncbi:hypothetical protein TNCV_4331501 [Trichonephila clavipes]|nr:hypothetical protein TNCV_4331501 [Trichonephila clavipes]